MYTLKMMARDSKRCIRGYKARKLARETLKLRLQHIPRSIMLAASVIPIATTAMV